MGTNIKRTVKIAITTERLGVMERFLSRSHFCDTTLSQILHFVPNCRKRVATLQKKKFLGHISQMILLIKITAIV